MFNGYLKQSTASQSRLIGPFVDATDFKTPETGLTIANTDIDLSKNGAASVSKNSGGGTHRVSGMYSITFDATDTNTVGELAGACEATGALPVYFKFFVLEEAIYDALFGASAAGFDASGRVDVGSWLGTAVTLSGTLPDINVAGMDAGVITATVMATDSIDAAALAADAIAEINATVDAALVDIGLDHLVAASVTGTDVTDNSIIARMVSSAATADWDTFVNTDDSLQAISESGGGGPTAAQIADAVWDEAQADHTTAATFGILATEIADILVDTAEIGAAGAGLTEAGGTGDHLSAIPWNAAWDAQVESEVNDALVALGLDHLVSAAVVGTDVTDNSIIARMVSSSATADWDTFVNTTESLQALRDRGDAAWITATGFSTHSAADVWTAVTRTLTANTNLNDPTAAAIADAVWDELQADHVTAATFGVLATEIADILVDTGTTIPGVLGTPAGASLAADIATVDTVVDAILDDTGTSGVVLATDAVDAAALSADAGNEIADAVLTRQMTEAYAADGVAPTLAQAQFLKLAVLTDFSIAGTTLTARKLDGVTTAATFTLDDATNPTDLTRAT